MQVTLTAMTEQEARGCIDRIKANVEATRALLLDLYEREGWSALGYASWRDCIKAEFEMAERTAYQWLDAAVVDKALCAIAQNPLHEAHARELAPLKDDPEAVREVYVEVQQATDSKPKAADYREAVARRLGAEAADIVDLEPPPDVAMAAMAEAAPLLREPDEERAYYLIGRQCYWMRLDPARVADTSSHPSQDAPEWDAFASWCARVACALKARAGQPVRIVR